MNYIHLVRIWYAERDADDALKIRRASKRVFVRRVETLDDVLLLGELSGIGIAMLAFWHHLIIRLRPGDADNLVRRPT
jgi:hypothetical protein